MFDWNDLRYFLAVARDGSTLAAAKVLRVSQSTVQRRLVELERSLKQRIVIRRPTGYTLTETGRALLSYAEKVEAAALELARHAASRETTLRGIVRLSCPEAFGSRLVRSKILDRFRRRYPGIRIELVMSTKSLDLSRGQADVAIRQLDSDDAKLFGRKIADAPWCIYAAPTYIAQRGRPATIGDIAQHDVIVFDGEMARHHSVAWMRAAAPEARIAATANNIAAMALIAKSGVGLAALPLMVGDPDEDLVRLLGPITGFNTPFHIFMHEDFKHTPRIRAVFDFVIEEISSIRPLFTGEKLRRKPVRRVSMRVQQKVD